MQDYSTLVPIPSSSGTAVVRGAPGAPGTPGADSIVPGPTGTPGAGGIPPWAPTTVYTLGKQVASPNNDVVTANVAHTSSAAYATDVAKWTLSPTYAPHLRIFNVRDYGAVGNGTTDDTAAINAALYAARMNTVTGKRGGTVATLYDGSLVSVIQNDGAGNLNYLAGLGASGGRLMDPTAATTYFQWHKNSGIGFFGATPVVRPAHPVTLADVITALTNLGLTA